MKIFVTNKQTGERFEITDLYWFEENGVHDFRDSRFTFQFQLGHGPIFSIELV